MLDNFISWFLGEVLGLNLSSRLGEAINFFVYDSVKIVLLLFFMVFFVGFLRTFISRRRIHSWLGRKRFGLENLFASLFGAFTPFCSCSSIPIFLGFVEAGVPLGVAFSFLITSPLVNEYLVVLMFGFFGWKITAAYVVGGVLIGFFGGIFLGRMKLEKYLIRDVTGSGSERVFEKEHRVFFDRFLFGFGEAKSILKKIWLWIFVGVGVGALIHNYVPQEAFESLVGFGGVFTVPLAVLLGVPMYGSCVAIVPIALVLFEKGIGLGTALAFMMAISALSLPEAVILRRAMKFKLILIFFGMVVFGIILIGYIFNFLQGIF